MADTLDERAKRYAGYDETSPWAPTAAERVAIDDFKAGYRAAIADAAKVVGQESVKYWSETVAATAIKQAVAAILAIAPPP